MDRHLQSLFLLQAPNHPDTVERIRKELYEFGEQLKMLWEVKG